MNEDKINGCVKRENPPVYHCDLRREQQPLCLGYKGLPPHRCNWQILAYSESGCRYSRCTEHTCQASAPVDISHLASPIEISSIHCCHKDNFVIPSD